MDQGHRPGYADLSCLEEPDLVSRNCPILDQAGWHMSARLIVPDNITLLPLSPRSPELNPVENVWQFMRDNWLSNRIFRSYDDIVDHCCDASNKLVDQPWRIMTIGRRQGRLQIRASGGRDARPPAQRL